MRKLLVVVTVAAMASLGLAITAPMVGAGSVDIVVPGTAGGPDSGGTAAVASGFVLGAGKSVVVRASGTVYLQPSNGAPNGPDGGNPSNNAGPGALVPFAPWGCLAARVGVGPWTCVGVGPTLVTGTGELQFGVNDAVSNPVGYADNSGSFAVAVEYPRANITIRKTLSGVDPGVPFPVKVACTATEPMKQDVGVGAAAADGEIVLVDGNLSGSATVQIPAGGSKTVEVWWPISNEGPVVENVTCTVSEDLSALPAGTTCTPTFTPADTTVVLYDLSDEIDRSSASFALANACSTMPASVPLQPTFTG